MALEFFCESLRDDVGFDLRLDVELLEPTVLLLKLLHPRHQRHVHAAVLAAPFIKRRRTDPVLSAQIRHRRPSLGLLQHREDLAVRKSRSLHVELPPTRKFYFSGLHLSGGITGVLKVKHGADPLLVDIVEVH
jgi:hypothetical protein